MKQELIEKALALTGKKLYEMNRGYSGEYEVEYKFCIAEFCYYLLSPEFIEKFHDTQYNEPYWIMDDYTQSVRILGEAIYEYQSGNEKPLEDLLSKICQ